MKHEELTKQQLADRFSVDVRTVTNWAQEGMPQRKKSGRPVFAWPECYAWREAQIREDARATRHAGDDPDRKTELAELRLRSARAEAEAAELDLAERRGQLVTLGYMTQEFERIAHALRARLLAAPPAWAARLGTCTTVVDRQLELAAAVNELLPVLAELADDDAPADGVERTA